jgi:23S rRNA (uracil1939-C5)-methyltransferase
MARKKKEYPVYEKVKVTAAGAEGKAIARIDNQVVFIPYAAPGDVIDVQVKKKRKSYLSGQAIHFHAYSDHRVTPKCKHFGQCGGCKWQHVDYRYQLQYKQQQVEDNLRRLGNFDMPDPDPILGSAREYYYRNKLEYTFSNKRWLVDFSKDVNFDDLDMDGLGFHMPGMFDRVLDIEECHLQHDPSNAIRLAFRKFAKQEGLDFYDVKNWTGFLRNVIIRTASTGDLMVILVVNHDDEEKTFRLLDLVAREFPGITSLMYVVNVKRNAVITDLSIKLYKGLPYIIEEMEGLRFKVGPVSFFQTNSDQAYELYKVARQFADLSGDEVVYDLYTGTGTIANFIAAKAKKVVGIEYVDSAIADAKENAALNGITNCSFFSGDLAEVLNEDFARQQEYPEVIITDPPRAGMHPEVVKQIMLLNPEKIVYVSCNPATQARDVTMLSEQYRVENIQPVDMFPHTHHVENVMKLVRKQS